MLNRIARARVTIPSRAMRPGSACRAPIASLATRLLLCLALACARVDGAREADLGASIHRRHAPPSAFAFRCAATLDAPARGTCAYLPPPHVERSSLASGPPLSRCELRWKRQRLDHFSFGSASDASETGFFSQRYFLCAAERLDLKKPAVFFYTGNEADVELYVNATGLMWEMASKESTSALLVFAEHRYYGLSRPKDMDDVEKSPRDRLAYLTSEQALADYADLLRHVKERDIPEIIDARFANEQTAKTASSYGRYDAERVAVVAFGGSYGGMLATWFRAKYPHFVDGAVAGSAPVWSFLGETPKVDPNAFALGVTFDATAWGGSKPACEANARAGFKELLKRALPTTNGSDPRRFTSVASPLRLCASSVPRTADDIVRLAYWVQDAFDYLAMGNFPYEDSYILMGDGTLPAFPFRAACGKTASEPDLVKKYGPDAALRVLADFADVYYNYSNALPCFDVFNENAGPNEKSASDATLWDWQYCSEMFMPTARDGVRDIFFPQPWNETRARERCVETWGVEPRVTWADTVYGGRRLRSLSNVVWSNGALDPWSRLGVTEDSDFLDVLDDSKGLEAVFLENGAHHLDFFWSRDDDAEDVRSARARETELVRRWIEEKHERISLRRDGRDGAGKKNGFVSRTTFWRENALVTF